MHNNMKGSRFEIQTLHLFTFKKWILILIDKKRNVFFREVERYGLD